IRFLKKRRRRFAPTPIFGGGRMGRSAGGIHDEASEISGGLLLGDGDRVVSGGRGVERGRERRVYLGPLLARAGKNHERGHGRRRLRPVPSLQRGRGANERARATRLPLQHLLASDLSGRQG